MDASAGACYRNAHFRPLIRRFYGSARDPLTRRRREPTAPAVA
jgi:hypothetical protein